MTEAMEDRKKRKNIMEQNDVRWRLFQQLLIIASFKRLLHHSTGLYANNSFLIIHFDIFYFKKFYHRLHSTEGRDPTLGKKNSKEDINMCSNLKGRKSCKMGVHILLRLEKIKTTVAQLRNLLVMVIMIIMMSKYPL